MTAGKTVTFHIWVPAGAALSAVQPYVQQGGAANYLWTGNYVNYSALNPNTWNTITVDSTRERHHANVRDWRSVLFATGNWTGNVYVDSVSW